MTAIERIEPWLIGYDIPGKAIEGMPCRVKKFIPFVLTKEDKIEAPQDFVDNFVDKVVDRALPECGSIAPTYLLEPRRLSFYDLI